MDLSLTEDQLTSIIKEAMVRYANKSFGYASFTQRENGIEVQFHDAGSEPSRTEDSEPEQAKQQNPMDVSDFSNLTNPISPFNILGGFGGFGGGSSGGGGASGGW